MNYQQHLSIARKCIGVREKWGAIAVIMGVIVFFVGQLAAQVGWDTRFSWADNNVSDLGHVKCGQFEGRYICSPLHAIYNTGAILTSLLIVPGLILMRRLWGRGAWSIAARLALTVAGSGYAIAGLTPPDVALDLHLLAVVLLMPVANVGLLSSAAVPRDSLVGHLRWFALGLGLLAITGSILHFGGPWLGLGRGGMERVAGFSPLLFMVIVSIHCLHVGKHCRAVSAGDRATSPR